MAQWKKVIVSGSSGVELADLTLDTALAVGSGGTGQSTLSSGEVLLGNGTSGITSVARGNITQPGGGQINIVGGTNAVLGGNVSLSLTNGVASGSNLNAISDLAVTDGNIIVGNGSTWVAESGATARTSLGLGTSDSVTFDNITSNGDINGGTLAGSQITGSFSGSFVGDGSQLTGLPAAAIATYTNPTNNRIITSVNSSTVNAEANLTFDGSRLEVTGTLHVQNDVEVGIGDVTLNGGLKLNGVTGGTTDVVYIQKAGNVVGTRTIDSRVWGSTLIDGSGASTRVTYFSDTDTVTSNAAFTFDGTDLTVGNSTFGTNVVIDGDLIVNGDTISQNVSNVNVEDKFILLNSGSAAGDGGIIVQTEAGFSGSAFGWDDSATRWAVQNNTKLGSVATSMVPDAYVAMAVDVDGGQTDIASHQVNGNIKIDGGEIYIYA